MQNFIIHQNEHIVLRTYPVDKKMLFSIYNKLLNYKNVNIVTDILSTKQFSSFYSQKATDIRTKIKSVSFIQQNTISASIWDCFQQIDLSDAL